MKKYFLFFYILFIFIFNTNYSLANQDIKFANIDLIIQKTSIGKKVLNKINQLDKKNIDKLKSFEDDLKSQENEIKLKKNLLSDEELNKEINNLNDKLADYNKQKKVMVKNLSNVKNNELQKLFKIINPIIQEYMSQNSIEILFNSKNIFFGNKNSDLTQELIDAINNKFNG